MFYKKFRKGISTLDFLVVCSLYFIFYRSFNEHWYLSKRISFVYFSVLKIRILLSFLLFVFGFSDSHDESQHSDGHLVKEGRGLRLSAEREKIVDDLKNK